MFRSVCPYCGAPLANAMFCSRCGKYVSRIDPRSKIRSKRVLPRMSSSGYVGLSASQIGARLGTDADLRREFVARTRQTEKDEKKETSLEDVSYSSKQGELRNQNPSICIRTAQYILGIFHLIP